LVVRILIVEDDRSNQDLLGYQAEDVPFDVSLMMAADGEEALVRAASAPIGVILLDLGMPRMDGFEFLMRLRALPGHSTTPVIVVTARDLTEDDHRWLKGRGVRRILQKGRYDTQALTQAITECAP
jgi:CheY-like chemotaxis protein